MKEVILDADFSDIDHDFLAIFNTPIFKKAKERLIADFDDGTERMHNSDTLYTVYYWQKMAMIFDHEPVDSHIRTLLKFALINILYKTTEVNFTPSFFEYFDTSIWKYLYPDIRDIIHIPVGDRRKEDLIKEQQNKRKLPVDNVTCQTELLSP